jgi:hypothetical protein
MSFITNLFGGNNNNDPARPTILGRNEGQRLRLNDYRKPWWSYWTTEGGEGFYVVGGPKRKEETMIPVLFPTRAIARSIAKYMTRSSRIRINGTLVH